MDVLRPMARSLVTLIAAQRQHRRVEWRAVEEEGDVGRAGADVGDGHAQVAFGLREDRLGRRQRCRHQLVDADAGLLDALAEVLDRGRAGVHDVGLDLEPDGAHADGILDALLAVDHEATRQDVQHLAVGGDVDGARDVRGPGHVLAGDLLARTADGDRAARVLHSTWSPPTPTKAASSCSPDRRSACSTAAVIELTVWSMLMTAPFLMPAEAGAPLPMMVERAVAADLPDERHDLARADVERDEDHLPIHDQATPSRSSA